MVRVKGICAFALTVAMSGAVVGVAAASGDAESALGAIHAVQAATLLHASVGAATGVRAVFTADDGQPGAGGTRGSGGSQGTASPTAQGASPSPQGGSTGDQGSQGDPGSTRGAGSSGAGSSGAGNAGSAGSSSAGGNPTGGDSGRGGSSSGGGVGGGTGGNGSSGQGSSGQGGAQPGSSAASGSGSAASSGSSGSNSGQGRCGSSCHAPQQGTAGVPTFVPTPPTTQPAPSSTNTTTTSSGNQNPGKTTTSPSPKSTAPSKTFTSTSKTGTSRRRTGARATVSPAPGTGRPVVAASAAGRAPHGALAALISTFPISSPKTTRNSFHRSSKGTTTVITTPGRTITNWFPELEHVVPVEIWIALGLALAFAALAGTSALWSRHRVRKQARQFAVMSTAAMTDPLTGVLNRRGFSEAVEQELGRAQRYGRPFVLAYVDVRGLKAVNDTEGHRAGDKLIREAALLLQDSARANDVVGRLGGDEMGLLLVEQNTEGAAAVQSRIEAHVLERRASIGLQSSWDLTIGTAAFPEDGETFDELLRAADRRLYAQRGIVIR